MTKPLVSVIIATYNRAPYIERAIKSILMQNYKNIEIIVVDDGSTDSTKEVLRKYDIRYVYQENAGCSVAKDNGIKQAQGKYIAILDSDDYWFSKDKLKDQVEFLEANSDYVLVGGWMLKLNKKGMSIGTCKYTEKDKEIRKAMLFDNMFSHSAVMYRKDSWEKVGGYCKILPANDWHLWLKLGKLGKMYNFQKILVCYSTDSQNISKINACSKLKIDIAMRKLYRNDYPDFWKAYILSWISYLYSYNKYKDKLYPITQFIKRHIIKKYVKS